MSVNTHERLGIPIGEACRILGVSRPSVYRLIHRGELRTYLIGSRRFTTQRFLEEAVDRLAKKSSVRPHRCPRILQENIDAIDAEAEGDGHGVG